MSNRPIHRDDARRIVWGFGAVLVLGLIGVIGVVVQAGGALPFVKYTYVKATFDNVGTLTPMKEVKENGIVAGIVTDISYDHGKALVTLRLNGSKAVYADATAAIANVNALGKKYVSFNPGSPAAGLLPGNELSDKQTNAGQSLEDILNVFDPATRKAVQSSLGELATGLSGHGSDLHAALAAAHGLVKNLGTVSAAVTSAPADLPGLLASANTLVGRFNGREQELQKLVQDGAATLKAIDVDHGQPLGRTVSLLPATLTDARAALDALDTPLADAHGALATLRPGFIALGQGTPALRSFLRTSPPALDKLMHVDTLAQPAVSDLTTTVQQARPLIAPLQRTIASADELLFSFAPYAGDAGRFFSQDALLSGTLNGDDSKHYFAAALTGVGLFSVAGVPDPIYNPEPYPCPGTAWNHATRTNCSGGAR